MPIRTEWHSVPPDRGDRPGRNRRGRVGSLFRSCRKCPSPVPSPTPAEESRVNSKYCPACRCEQWERQTIRKLLVEDRPVRRIRNWT